MSQRAVCDAVDPLQKCAHFRLARSAQSIVPTRSSCSPTACGEAIEQAPSFDGGNVVRKSMGGDFAGDRRKDAPHLRICADFRGAPSEKISGAAEVVTSDFDDKVWRE